MKGARCMRSDFITGLTGAIFSGLYLYATANVKIFGGAATAGVNAQTIPKLWGTCLLLLSVILIARSIYKYVKGERGKSARELIEVIRERREVAYTFILLILYAVLMKPVGFIISSIVYVYLQIWVLTPITARNKRMHYIAAGLAVFFSISLYYVFTKYLMVMLPPGILR